MLRQKGEMMKCPTGVFSNLTCDPLRADRSPWQLGVPGPFISYIHELPVPLANHCPVRARGQPHWVLPKALYHATLLERPEVCPLYACWRMREHAGAQSKGAPGI